jgi:hypothetical protein
MNAERIRLHIISYEMRLISWNSMLISLEYILKGRI